jgi:hypothetical protein
MIDLVNKALDHMCPPAIASMFHIYVSLIYDCRSALDHGDLTHIAATAVHSNQR